MDIMGCEKWGYTRICQIYKAIQDPPPVHLITVY